MSQPGSTVPHPAGSQPPDERVASGASGAWPRTLAWQVTACPEVEFLVCRVEAARASASPQGAAFSELVARKWCQLPCGCHSCAPRPRARLCHCHDSHAQGPYPPPGTDAVVLVSKQGPDPPLELPNPVCSLFGGLVRFPRAHVLECCQLSETRLAGRGSAWSSVLLTSLT